MAEICYHNHRLLTEGIWGGSDGKTGILHGKISDISGDDQSYFKIISGQLFNGY